MTNRKAVPWSSQQWAAAYAHRNVRIRRRSGVQSCRVNRPPSSDHCRDGAAGHRVDWHH